MGGPGAALGRGASGKARNKNVGRKLSDRQQQILDYIQAYVEDRGYPPSIREIGDRVGISSTSVVDYNLRALERDGLIRRDREVSRGLEVVGGSRSAPLAIPPARVMIMGRIAAGMPIEAIEDPTDSIELAAGSVPEDAYALIVKGTSMIEDHIDDGDIVVIRPQRTAQNGDIVVAVIDEEGSGLPNGSVTLKRFYRQGPMIRLEPRNPTMQPIVVPSEKVDIRGKVVKLIRDL